MDNKGIIVKDNSSITANVIAVGDNATIISRDDKDYRDITIQINELKQLLLQNKESISNLEELLDSVSILSKELEKGNPNKTVIKGILSELASSISSVTSLASAVSALKAAILSII